MKNTHEIFDKWCGKNSNAHIAENVFHGEVTSKQVGFWRTGKAEPGPKKRKMMNKYGFFWTPQATMEYLNGDSETESKVYGPGGGSLSFSGKPVIETIPTPQKPKNFTVEFEYSDAKFGDSCEGCYHYEFNRICHGVKRCKIEEGYIITVVKKYVNVTRHNIKLGVFVKCKTAKKHGYISYIKKHQNQCVVDWGNHETTISFESLEILED